MLRNTGRVEFEYSVFGAEGGAGPPPPGQMTVHPTSVSKVCWVSGCYWWRVGCVWVLLVESGLCVGVVMHIVALMKDFYLSNPGGY